MWFNNNNSESCALENEFLTKTRVKHRVKLVLTSR